MPHARSAILLSILLALPATALADETPGPVEVKQPPPPAPPTPAKTEPVKTEPAKADAPVKAAAPPAKAPDAKKTESGGMCRAGAPAGGWELLALLALGLRRRRG